MPGDELTEQIGTFRKELFGLRFANATGELEDTAEHGAHEARPRASIDGGARARDGSSANNNASND